MTIIDDARDWQQAITDRAALTQQVADLANQVATAQLQYQNDEDVIQGLKMQLAQAQSDVATLTQAILNLKGQLAADDASVTDLRAQLAQLNSVKVYDGLEYNAWAINSKAQVGGSGVGTSGYKIPDATGMAELWIKPGPRPDPTKPNYFDSYDTQDFLPLDDAITRWRMENTFLFPTQADADACNCLELEARQVLLNGNMYVAGTQFNFGNNAWRYWDHFKKWTPSGQPCPLWTAGKLYHAAVDAHRDDANTYHDSISLNDQKVPLAVSYSTWKESPAWRQMLRCAIQLDAKDVAFRMLIGRTKFTVSQ